MNSILVVAEQKDGQLRPASLHAISLAKKLAEVSGQSGAVVGLVLGDDPSQAATELSQYGVSKVMTAAHPTLKNYTAEAYAAAVVAVARRIEASAIVATATTTGKDLLPRVAALLDAAMASDVSEVISANQFKRPMVAGNVIGTVTTNTKTVVISARQTAWASATASGTNAPIETCAVGDIGTLGAEVLRIESVKSERPELTEAKVVVSGGRGMKASENFKHLEVLADVLGGAMGATRAACDAGLVPNDLQVGQTGKVVAPQLYIAVGISGAIQHLAGMKGSKVIVAINKDPEAPIFQVADYGLVAKWEDTVGELTEKLRAIKSAS